MGIVCKIGLQLCDEYQLNKKRGTCVIQTNQTRKKQEKKNGSMNLQEMETQ